LELRKTTEKVTRNRSGNRVSLSVRSGLHRFSLPDSVGRIARVNGSHWITGSQKNRILRRSLGSSVLIHRTNGGSGPIFPISLPLRSSLSLSYSVSLSLSLSLPLRSHLSLLICLSLISLDITLSVSQAKR
jgi:hypothetical protein